MSKDSKCRFIEEYANFKKVVINEDYYLTAEEKRVKVNRVNKLVSACRMGHITVDETMRGIADINV